jgi:hypothetical protein
MFCEYLLTKNFRTQTKNTTIQLKIQVTGQKIPTEVKEEGES